MGRKNETSKNPRKQGNLFDGDTYDPSGDESRLASQLSCVLSVMSDGRWRTLFEIRGITGFPEASISARLRDLRKPKFGAHTIDRQRRGKPANGLFEYRMVL